MQIFAKISSPLIVQFKREIHRPDTDEPVFKYDTYTVKPGHNNVPDEVWDEMKEDDRFKHREAEGILRPDYEPTKADWRDLSGPASPSLITTLSARAAELQDGQMFDGTRDGHGEATSSEGELRMLKDQIQELRAQLNKQQADKSEVEL